MRYGPPYPITLAAAQTLYQKPRSGDKENLQSPSRQLNYCTDPGGEWERRHLQLPTCGCQEVGDSAPTTERTPFTECAYPESSNTIHGRTSREQARQCEVHLLFGLLRTNRARVRASHCRTRKSSARQFQLSSGLMKWLSGLNWLRCLRWNPIGSCGASWRQEWMYKFPHGLEVGASTILSCCPLLASYAGPTSCPVTC